MNLVKSAHGSIKIGFVMQIGADWASFDKYSYAGISYNGKDTFQIKPTRARLILSGFVLDKRITYLLQFDGVQGLQSILPASAGKARVFSTAAEPAAPGVPFLLDLVLSFQYIPKTTLKVGRFLSQWSYMMPRNTADLYMIYYPLVIQRLAAWRQLSIESITETKYVDFVFGIYNGPSNNWGDNNLYKDFNVKLRFKPVPWMHVGVFTWIGMPNSTYAKSCPADPCVATDLTRTKSYALDLTYGGELYIHVWEDRFKFLVEGMARTHLDWLERGGTEDFVRSTTRYGLYLHTSIQPVKPFEILLRADIYDPAVAGYYNPATGGNRAKDKNATYWMTFGMNYFLDGMNAKLSLDYVYKHDQIVPGTGPILSWSEVLAQASLFF